MHKIANVTTVIVLILLIGCAEDAPEPVTTEELDKDGPANLPESITGKDSAPMVLIPAGEFQMGDTFDEGMDDERPVHKVYLDAFYMDVYEVTNTLYARFMNEYGKNTNAKGHKLLDIDDSLLEKAGDTYTPKAGYEDYAVVEVTSFGAEAYAEFYGKRLPTEAEWEKAARGGLVGKRYPWGDDISHDDANYKGTGGRDVWVWTCPVGSFPPSGYGLYDIAGNVIEWCADWHDSNYYSRPPPYRNPQGADPADWWFRVLRGGSCRNEPYGLRVARRNFHYPTELYSDIGFRCVQDVSP